ncbi:MAG: VCBS repeat-containing protein [Planctomycetota bacterium]
MEARILALGLLVPALPAQQLLWQLPMPPLTPNEIMVAPFGDFNHDGYRDFLQYEFLLSYPSQNAAVQVRSGTNGSVLWQVLPFWATTSIADAGDVNGDGEREVAILVNTWGPPRVVQIWSPATNSVLWEVGGSFNGNYGGAMLGALDVNGDGLDDFIVLKTHPNESEVYVYNNRGNLLYSLPMTAIGWTAVSVANMGDMDSDGCDDFLLGCAEPSGRGALRLVSGRTGATIRTTYGVLPSALLMSAATNLGDIDGDQVNDYAGFGWSQSSCVAFSGATGSVIRTWPFSTDSVVATEDFDLDGVPDMFLGGGFTTTTPGVYGRAFVLSGRDGSTLWSVDNYTGSGFSGFGWARYAAGLGVLPGSPYPAVAWMDQGFVPGVGSGRTRAFLGTRAGQGPVTGTPCSSLGASPLIGVRETTTGARITIAKGPPGALAWLGISLGNPTTFAGVPLPMPLDPFGLPGCFLHVSPDIIYVGVLGTAGIDRGYAAVDLSLHCAAAGLGTVFSAQWLAFDPATLAYATTSKHQLRLQ